MSEPTIILFVVAITLSVYALAMWLMSYDKADYHHRNDDDWRL